MFSLVCSYPGSHAAPQAVHWIQLPHRPFILISLIHMLWFKSIHLVNCHLFASSLPTCIALIKFSPLCFLSLSWHYGILPVPRVQQYWGSDLHGHFGRCQAISLNSLPALLPYFLESGTLIFPNTITFLVHHMELSSLFAFLKPLRTLKLLLGSKTRDERECLVSSLFLESSD